VLLLLLFDLAKPANGVTGVVSVVHLGHAGPKPCSGLKPVTGVTT